MPIMQPSPVAVLCSDLHLRHTVPSGRAESNWYDVMFPYLKNLREVSYRYGIPIICAGDVFDRWNPPAELVSWAIDHLPEMYAIPGQHDLNGHDYERRMDGAYGALVKAGIIHDLIPEAWTVIRGGLAVWANPWGRYLFPDHGPLTHSEVSLQVIHKYVYTDSSPSKYYGAPEDAEYRACLSANNKLVDYILIGDNHIRWNTLEAGNPGSLIPMKQDQMNHMPAYGLLSSSGLAEWYEYDVPAPKWQTLRYAASLTEKVADDVIAALGSLETVSESFSDRLFRAAENAACLELSKILREVWEQTRK